MMHIITSLFIRCRTITVLLVLSLFVSGSTPAAAADNILRGFVKSEYNAGLNFINQDRNILEGNITSLDHFYEKLYQLKASPDSIFKRISIFHLGDSHLQAGFLSCTVMRDFHRDFGNGGRGLIIPLKLAKTNEPSDYTIASNTEWLERNLCTRKPQFSFGIGGMSILSKSNKFEIYVKTTDINDQDYSFTKVKIFHHPNAPKINVVSPDTISCKNNSYPFVSEYELKNPSHEIKFMASSSSSADSSILYGMSLETNRKGILYHAVGINGAQFIHYNRVPDMNIQIQSISPDLMIFSLGTNEAFRGVNIKEERLVSEINRLIIPIKEANPNVDIIFTTPAECKYPFKSEGKVVYGPNIYMQSIRDGIVRYAKENGYAYWDLYNISGGKNSSLNWVNADLLAKDGIHFKVPGYRIQGNLLYQAIIKGYNEYVKNRH